MLGRKERNGHLRPEQYNIYCDGKPDFEPKSDSPRKGIANPEIHLNCGIDLKFVKLQTGAKYNLYVLFLYPPICHSKLRSDT
jgi:hypothetical protein